MTSGYSYISLSASLSMAKAAEEMYQELVDI